MRNTLNAGLCDLVIGITTTSELLQNSNPYYRSSYVLLQRADAEPQIDSLHDPALKTLRIGAVARTPPVSLLARQGLLGKLKPYQLVVDTRFVIPGRDMVEDVASGEVDIGVLWGPIAGFWAERQPVPLEITPLVGEEKGLRLDFRISMGHAARRAQLEARDQRSAGGQRAPRSWRSCRTTACRCSTSRGSRSRCPAEKQGPRARSRSRPATAGRLPGAVPATLAGASGGDHRRAAGADRRAGGRS